MNTKRKTIIGILLFALFLVIAYFTYSALSSRYKPAEETKTNKQTTTQKETKTLAPDFTVYDINGRQVKLSDLRGKPVVVNFWASWCPPCKGELPDFNEVYANEKDNVVFMMVDLTDGQRETQIIGEQYIKDMKFTFPVYFDLKQQTAETYGISSIPDTLFIDSKGYVVKAYQGAIDKETLEEGIKQIQKMQK